MPVPSSVESKAVITVVPPCWVLIINVVENVPFMPTSIVVIVLCVPK